MSPAVDAKQLGRLLAGQVWNKMCMGQLTRASECALSWLLENTLAFLNCQNRSRHPKQSAPLTSASQAVSTAATHQYSNTNPDNKYD